ncbi:MAG: ribosome recycling factor [Bacteroidaceae bacterium]|nr:ribosome recycling factor [Bacteroidaceae bacterium]
MRKAVVTLIGEMKNKMGGYAVLLQYRYMNLCIKAEPASLLSLEVVDGEEEKHIFEETAFAMLINDFQFEIVPKENELLFPICRALMKTHPEFKQEVLTAEKEDRLNIDDEEEKHIIVTMPEVDKNRRDLLMNAVSTLYDECGVQLDKAKGDYTNRLLSKMAGESPNDIDEAKNSLEDAYNQHKDIIKTYRENKENEIEEAYQKWLTKQEAKEQEQQEKDEAMGEKAAKSLNFDN